MSGNESLKPRIILFDGLQKKFFDPNSLIFRITLAEKQEEEEEEHRQLQGVMRFTQTQ